MTVQKRYIGPDHGESVGRQWNDHLLGVSFAQAAKKLAALRSMFPNFEWRVQ